MFGRISNRVQDCKYNFYRLLGLNFWLCDDINTNQAQIVASQGHLIKTTFLLIGSKGDLHAIHNSP